MSYSINYNTQIYQLIIHPFTDLFKITQFSIISELVSPVRDSCYPSIVSCFLFLRFSVSKVLVRFILLNFTLS